MITSNTPPPEALAAINSGVSRIIRSVEIYESDGETLWVPPNQDTRSRLVSGTISIDYSRDDRRNIDLVLDNSDGMLDMENSNGFWYDKILKPFRGVRYPIIPTAPHYETYAEWQVQCGEFMIDKISESNDVTQAKVVGRDYVKKCLTSKLEQSVSFSPGTFIYQLISSLASNAGIRKINLPFTTDTLGTTLDIERGTDRWSVMVKAANSNNFDLYFDNQGILVMEKYSDPALSPVSASFSTGPEGNLVKFEKSTDDSRLYNHIIVTGDREAVEGGDILLPYFGEARNEDPGSPTSIDRIGDRAYFYASSFFTADSQCEDLANAWLSIYSLESYEINWSSIVYPWLDVGKVIEMSEPKKSDSITRFLLDTLNISLGLEPMSATGKRLLTVL